MFSTCTTFALEAGMSVNTLPSGQKVVIKEVKDNNIVKIDTWINTGSINEDDKTWGISHFLEHLFFKGTQKYPTGTMDKILDSKGATVNAGTSKDFTHYYIEIPSKDFDTALELHADMLLNPMIPRKELERERSVVIEEISRTKDSPSGVTFDNLYKALYSKSNHPYRRNVIGIKENIQNVTREEILNYFNRFYTPDAYTTVIVGDVDKDEALKKVAAAFKQNNKRKQEKINYPKIKPLDKVERINDEMDISKTHFMIAYLAPKFSITTDNYALDVLSTMLTSGKSSILNQNLKEKKELVLSISSGNYSQKDSGMFYIYATLDPNKEENLEKEILNEINKIKAGNFPESMVEKAKNQIKTDTYYSRESISNISEDLGYDFTFIDDVNFYENYLKNIDKVTKKDIIRVAKKYLLDNEYATSTTRPKGFKKIADIKEDSFVSNDKILEQKEKETKYLLSNGLTLTSKKKTSNSIIAMDITINGSKAVESKPALSMITSNSVLTGTKNYNNSELAEFLDENGIKLAITNTNDIFSIVIQTTKDNLEKAFLILDEVLNKPAFSSWEVQKVKTRKTKELESVSDNPSSYVFDEFKRLAYLNSIYGQSASYLASAIKNITRDDVANYYSKLINPENMHVAIVGDVDDNYVIKKLNKIIRKNPTGSKFSFNNVKYSPYHPNKNVETTLYKKDVQVNWLALGYKTCGVQNRHDIAVLSVINAILGEGMSSRLFVKLREEKGLAYTVGSTVSTNVSDGAFITYIGTNEKGIEEAKKGILNEINILKTEMVTTKELNDAKDKIMGKFLLSIETNMDEANLLSWYSALGRNLNALEEYKKMIMNVSQNDIIEVANKYFSAPYIYTVVKKQP